MRPRKLLPLLSSVIGHRRAPDGGNLCFHRAAALVLDLPSGFVCIGTVRAASPEELEANPDASPVPFLHAWVEVAGSVYSPTLMDFHGGQLMPIAKRTYYRENGIRDVYRMNRRDLKRLADEHGWCKLPFGEHNGGPGVGRVLIAALGVPHKLDGARVLAPD